MFVILSLIDTFVKFIIFYDTFTLYEVTNEAKSKEDR